MPISGPPLSKPAVLTNLFDLALSKKPNEVALISGDLIWTWQELQQDIDAIALGLVAMGMQKGDRIASLLPNRGEILVFYLACLKAGLIATPLNYRYTPSEIDYALDVSGAVALCAGSERSDDVRGSALAGTMQKGLISFGGPLDNARRFEDLIATTGDVSDLPTTDLDDSAFIFFTSGSTGKPKGVTHSLSSFGSIAASFASALSLTMEDVVLPGGSIAHVGSLSTAFAALSAGATVVIPYSFDGTEILSNLRSHRPTVLLMLPAALIEMERDPDAKAEDFASLRLCVTGGDKFPLSVNRDFSKKTGLVIQETYGLTEATDCLFNPSTSPAKAGSVGTVAPGYFMSVRDDGGQEVPSDVDGNLWLSGVPVMTGYWANPEATQAVFDDEGWFDTGDIMQVDSDGYFWFRGRKKQIIVHDGSNISPQEIEEVVMAYPAVDLAGVVGVPDLVHGENVWAYVTLKDDGVAPPVEDMMSFAKERVGYKAPVVIKILDRMPLNPSGKVDRATLKRMAEGDVQN